MKRRILSVLMAIIIGTLSIGIVSVSADKGNIVNIDLPLDAASELTWIASNAVTVSTASSIGGRNNVLKVEGLANSNNNTAGVKLPDGFSFESGDVLTYSIDVYSSTAINPDMWIRNHDGSLTPFAQFSHTAISTNTWTTVTKTVTYAEMVSISTSGGSSGEFATAGNYALYIRPRQSATVYLDNFTVTVAREGYVEPEVVMGNIINVDLPLDAASELTWIASDAVTVSTANGIGGRNNVLKVDGLANSNNNTAGIKLPDGFSFQSGDIITYSLDVYSSTEINPDMWLRNHNGSVLTPFTTFYHTPIATNTWTTITKEVTFDDLGTTYNWTTVGNYALYIRPRSNATVYLDNLQLTVARVGYIDPNAPPEHVHTYGEWASNGSDTHKKTCSDCGEVVTRDHTWDAGVVTKEPTYTATGTKTYTCTACSQTKTTVIDKLVQPSERPTITVGSATTCLDNEVTIPVSISKNSGLMGLKIEIGYDSDVLTLTGATKGTALGNLIFTRGQMSANPATFIWDGTGEDSTNGTILQLTFKSATKGEHAISVNVKTAVDDGLNDIATNANAGKVTIESHSYGSWVSNGGENHKMTCEYGHFITEPHEWDEGVVTKAATHTTTGTKKYTCTVCNYTKTESIAISSSSHTYNSYVTNGEKTHKKICPCGAFVSELHNWDEGVITTQPTATTKGIKTYTCTECGEQKTKVFGTRLPTENDTNITVGSVSTKPGTEITVPVSISKNAGITGMQMICNFNSDALTLIGVEKGDALASLEYTQPGDLSGSRLKFMWDGEDADTSNGDILLLNFKVSDTASGEYQALIEVEIACDQDINEIPVYIKNGTVTVQQHIHTYGEWVTDGADNHKQICSDCGDVKIEAHDWDEGYVTIDPTTETTGEIIYTCSVCDEQKTEVLDKLPILTTITVGKVEAGVGSEVVVPVYLSNNGDDDPDNVNYTGLAGLTINIKYDTTVLSYSKAEQGEALTSLDLTTPGRNYTEGNLTFTWDSTDCDNTDGEILLITFNVLETALEGDYKIDVTVTGACDYDMIDLETVAIDGKVTVITQKLGDINDDKVIDVKDAILIRRFIAGGYGVTLKEKVADVNKDNEIDVKDVILVRRYIAGGYGVEIK